MIAYNKQSLDNLYMREQLEDAFLKNQISMEELKKCKEKYPVNLYTPNVFVRIGLFVLTIVIVLFSLGLIGLITSIGGSDSFTGLLIFFAAIAYGVLEFMIRSKKHFKSGVDDALMWMSAIFIIVAFNLNGNMEALENSILVFVIASYFTVRFLNMIMSAIASFALLAVIFFAYIKLGEFAKATTPFLIMAVALAMYFLTAKKSNQEGKNYYESCLLMTEIVSLACFYIAGNYFVVREVSISMFNLNLKDGESVPFEWIFWIFTVAVPFIYLAKGILKKNILLIRMGLILIAAVVFTVRYYYHVLPAETAMIIGGIITIAIAYALKKYLNEPKSGFTDEQNTEHSFTAKQLEALLIAQTLGHAKIETTDGNATEFGGGSGGGGGAGGEF
ncbi:MAG TPA: hypothetical protein VKT28_18995 [Puia sp.]|nr:hypothetical protein [Puia sp.]